MVVRPAGAGGREPCVGRGGRRGRPRSPQRSSGAAATLRWGGRDYSLRPASRWKERYALADGDRELALLDGKGWGKRPVRVTVDDVGAMEPGVLLFAAYVVRGLAEAAGAAASG